MRKVIDSNQLRSLELRAFLAQSRHNIAVLTDYSVIEAYKGSSLEGIYRSMSILSDFSDQVVILKATSVVCGLNGRAAGLQKRLIDSRQTVGFGQYVQDLRSAQAGNREAHQKLLDHGAAASVQVGRILKDTKALGEGIQGIAKLYSQEERALIRLNQSHTPELIDKTGKFILELAAQMFGSHPKVTAIPTYGELLNTFIFRHALCTFLLALDWGANGGVQDAKPERLQNDLIDMNFAAYGTFFDGLMSGDAKCLQVHKQARIWLRRVFQCRLSGG